MGKPPIKNWPEEERPREKLVKFGKEHLTSCELLAIIIGTGCRKDNQSYSALDLASNLVSKYKNLKEMGEMTEKFDEQSRMMEMMKKQMIYDKFEGVIEKLKQERRALKQYGNISANDQFKYFMESKGKGMSKDELELLKRMVNSNEIPQIALSPPDEDGEGIDILPLTKYELKKFGSQIKKLEDDDQMSDEQMQEYEEGLKKNLEIARKAND